jgi:hypothetical protein
MAPYDVDLDGDRLLALGGRDDTLAHLRLAGAALGRRGRARGGLLGPRRGATGLQLRAVRPALLGDLGPALAALGFALLRRDRSAGGRTARQSARLQALAPCRAGGRGGRGRLGRGRGTGDVVACAACSTSSTRFSGVSSAIGSASRPSAVTGQRPSFFCVGSTPRGWPRSAPACEDRAWRCAGPAVFSSSPVGVLAAAAETSPCACLMLLAQLVVLESRTSAWPSLAGRPLASTNFVGTGSLCAARRIASRASGSATRPART